MKTVRPIRWMFCILVLVAVVLGVVLSGGSGRSSAATDADFCQPDRTARLPDAGTGHPPAFDARMRVGPGVAIAGEEPSIRIVNSGRDLLEWSNQRIDRSVRGGWVPMRMPGGSAEPAFSILVPPESITGCTGPETGRGWPGGPYRWTLHVKAVPRSRAAEVRELSAIFRLRAR